MTLYDLGDYHHITQEGGNDANDNNDASDRRVVA
jgi:hypothetical protein